MQPAPPSPNRATYESAEYVGRYTRQESLLPAEEKIFQRYEHNFSGAVLDIAIGAGRTTKVLLPRARRYIGVDLSQGMVEAARRHFGTADLRVLDMREVRSSNGQVEKRYAVALDVTLAGRTITTVMTLSNRDEMGFRMLIGREALERGFLVDSSLSYAGGRPRRAVRRKNWGK